MLEDWKRAIVKIEQLEKEIKEIKDNFKTNKTESTLDTGNITDGYHTFNELYHHRAVLFALICNQNKELAWKSKLHDDRTMFEGMFIVGLETPYGQVTYHYNIIPYWDMFHVETLLMAPPWDEHTSDMAAHRIMKFATTEVKLKMGQEYKMLNNRGNE